MFAPYNILAGLGYGEHDAHLLGLGKTEPGQTYVVTDTRTKPRKALDELATFKNFDIEESEPGQADNGIKLVPVKSLHVATHLFQNRADNYSHDSVDRIINAVIIGAFDWAAFDAITIWNNPEDNKFYILSGHSRTEAFKKLSMQDRTAQGKGFDKIPAKEFNGTFDEAREFALNSNTLSTKESDFERANYYRNLRLTGTPEKDIREKVKESEGRDANRIYAFSFLSPDGKTIAALKSLERGETQSRAQLQSVAAWIGKARATWPQLTTAHENELYDWLVAASGYGTKAGQVSNERDFLQRVQTAVNRNTDFGTFNTDAPLNILSKQYLSPIELEHKRAIDEAEQTINEAKKALDAKRKQLIASKVTGEDFERVIKAYNDAVTIATRKVIELKNRSAQVSDAAKMQVSLFGLGRLTFGATEIVNGQSAVLDFAGYKPTYKILSDYSHLIDPSAGTLENVGFGGVDKTIATIRKVILQEQNQTVKLAKHLYDANANQYIFNVWHWMKLNLKYNFDPVGKEWVRTPARTFADRFTTGADCEDFTIFASALFLNMGLSPKMLVVAFNGKAQFGHIYPVCNGLVADAVMNEFNKHPDHITKTMEIDVLRGMPKGKRAIAGLGELAPATTVTEELMNWQSFYLNKIGAGTATKRDFYEYSKVRMAIMANGTPDQAALMAIMPYVERISADGHFIFKSEFINRVYYKPETIDEATATEQDKQALYGLAGMIDANPCFNDIDCIEGIYDGIDGLGKKFKDTKFGKALNKVGKVLKKVAPPLVAARAAWLLIAKTNMKKYGYKMAVGYMTEAEATAKGISKEKWQKLVNFKNKAEKGFEKAGGNKKNLRKAVLKSKAAKRLGLRGLDVYEDVNGLGEPVTLTAVATATIPVVLAILDKMSKGAGTEGDMGLDAGVEENYTTATLDETDGFTTADEREAGAKASYVINNEPGPAFNQNPTGKPTTDPDKKDNTYWYVAGGAALLLGGVLLMKN